MKISEQVYIFQIIYSVCVDKQKHNTLIYLEFYDIRHAFDAQNGHALGVTCRIPFLEHFRLQEIPQMF